MYGVKEVALSDAIVAEQARERTETNPSLANTLEVLDRKMPEAQLTLRSVATVVRFASTFLMSEPSSILWCAESRGLGDRAVAPHRTAEDRRRAGSP